MRQIRQWFRERGGAVLILVLAGSGLMISSCSKDTPQVTTPADPGQLALESPAVGLAPAPVSGTSPASVSRLVNASQGAEIALGRYKIKIEPGALYKSMSVTLTVLDATRNRFQVGPAGVVLTKPMRLSMNAAGLGSGSNGVLRFFYRGASWTALATTRTATDVVALHDRFGEFSVGTAAPAVNGTISAR